ncbi:MAG: type II secretion system GspH family protein [Alphaproteobacteria bacterium]|nr:type II secretion system GspH family protein [Alphaproteobacteria bacterium]
MQTLNKKQQSGRSMIEMVGVLAVMGLITAGAFVLISNASASQRRNRVIDDIMNIAAGVRSLYAEHDTFPTIASATVLSALSINSTSPYNSIYTVAKVSGTTFSVSVPNPNANDCSALEIKNWKDAVSKTCDTTNNKFTVTFNK